MADVRPAGPEGGGNGDGALPARGRVWRRTRELYHDILTAFGKEKNNNNPYGVVSYSVGFAGGVARPAGGRGPAAVMYNDLVTEKCDLAKAVHCVVQLRQIFSIFGIKMFMF